MSIRQRPIKATTRASMIESWDQMDTILCALEGIGDEIPDRLVIRALTLAIWHLLRWTVMRIDKERTKKGTDAMDKKELPPFNADAAEEFITQLCIDAKNQRNEVYRKDNERRDGANPWYSDLYYRLLGQEMAYRRVLEYFAQFDLNEHETEKDAR